MPLKKEESSIKKNGRREQERLRNDARKRKV